MSTEPNIGQLLGVIDRLEALLEASELSEIEVEAGGTTLVLRKPEAVAQQVAAVAASSVAGSGAAASSSSGHDATGGQAGAAGAPEGADSRYHAVVAPLTGVYYGSPSPGAAAYVRVGGAVNAGQVIGLIEAMKLFNEIKSDVTGTVRRIAAESGALVKAKQALIEVEPG